MKGKVLELLYHSFDEKLTTEDQATLDRALSQFEELRTEKERLEKMRSLVQSSGEEGFHPFFAEKVVSRIRARKHEGDIFFNALVGLFRPVIIGAAILFFGLISYNIIKSGEFSLESAFGEPQVTLEQVIDPVLSLKLE